MGRKLNHHLQVEHLQTPAVAASYPFEVIHVGGLYWSSYESQVVDFCRLLVSLVGLDKHLVGKQKGKQSG